MNDGSQNQSDSGNENVDTEFTGGINQNKGLQSDSELANQDQNRENAGEISDSEEAELLQMKIGSPDQPARAQRPRMEIDPSNSGEMKVETQLPTQLASAQRPRMERNPSDTREMRAHNPHVTQRENRDDPNHRTTFNTLDGSIGQVGEQGEVTNQVEGAQNQSSVSIDEEVSAQRPHLRHTDQAEDDQNNVSAHRPHPTRSREEGIESEVDDFRGVEQIPGNAVLDDKARAIQGEIVDEPIQLQCGLVGDAQRPPDDLEGQEAFELGAHRPQTADAMPRRSSRPVKKPEYLRDYVTEIDDFCD